MARCNLFRKLENPTGEFLMFSQFAEDIARQAPDGVQYRVSPSRFAVFDINYPSTITGTTINTRAESIPVLWQSYYENSIALVKERIGDSWKPSLANELLWQFMIGSGWITKSTSGEVTYTELKYVGDIPFYNNRDEDDVVYNEIYCHIPVSASARTYTLKTQTTEQGYDPNYFYTGASTDIIGWNSSTYHGITGGLTRQGYDSVNGYTLFGNIKVPKVLYKDDASDNSADTTSDYTTNEDTYFEFNTILIFYDIWDIADAANPVCLYKNIPLGVYLLGIEDDEIVNFRKIVSNDDAFGQGSSFGVRIMTRFSPCPNSSSYMSEVSTDTDGASLSFMMGQMGDLIADLRSSMSTTTSLSESMKDHLAYFKNYRTNVPYIRLVGDNATWFVNGRNTGYPAIVNEENWREVYSRLGLVIYDDDETTTWNEQTPSQAQQDTIDANVNTING